MLNIFKKVEWLLYFCLCIVSAIFMNEVLEKYFSKDSSFKHYHEPITEQPTITICFSPHMDDNGNEYHKDYEYSTDFTINFHHANIDNWFNFGILGMTENKLNDTSKADIMVKLEKIYTLISGLCYKITLVSNVYLIDVFTEFDLHFNKCTITNCVFHISK